MDNPVTDVANWAGALVTLIKGLGAFLGTGTLGYGLLGGAAALLLILFFVFRSKILNFLREAAKKASDAIGNKTRQDADDRAKEGEDQLNEVAEKLKALEQNEKKKMLDELSFEELKDFAVQAHGEDATKILEDKNLSELAMRYEIYLLYGLKPAS